MFEVIESLLKEPMRFIAVPNREFRPGLIGTLKEIGGNIVCDICGPGDNPIGIIHTKLNSGQEISFKKEDMISVHTQRMIFRTNCFDAFQRYETGMGLHVNDIGLLTSKTVEDDDTAPLGRIITGPNGEYSHFEALWY